ncbi:MAG: AsmA-like C-terminal region-containing protein, partial [Elusimicrobiota bacterium]
WKEKELDGTAEGLLHFAGPLKELSLTSMSVLLRNFTFSHAAGKKISQADINLKSSQGWKDLSVSVPKGSYVAYANALSGLDLDFRVAESDLVFKKFDVTWNESRIRLRGCMKNFRQAEKVFFDGSVDRFKVDETYSAIENLIVLRKKEKGQEIVKGRPWASTFRFGIPDKFPNLEGRLLFGETVSPNFASQNFKLELALDSISRGLREVDGMFKIGFGPGRIREVPDVRKANKLLNVLILPFSYMHEIYQKARLSMDTAVLKTLDITRTYGDFSVTRGKVDVRYIHFDSPQFAAFADGTADFSIEDVDLDVLMRMMASGARLPDRLVDIQGRPSIKIKVKDNLSEPKVDFSLKKVGAGDLENALSEGLKRGTRMEPIDDKLTCGRK